ncbi:hypothetical protein FRB94_003117 [Tulasnella sp. JGI-2019a]|nr:hypothetical protein FRB94_003117 [Tulasnella sp. JGI-2019a]KAG9017800.1 hypothetical protein FRB93_004611 [Tulasnella sp. JGI-2019a]
MESTAASPSSSVQNGPTITVSTTFYPSARLPGSETYGIPDMIIYTTDFVFFYGHQDKLLQISTNAFAHTIPASISPVPTSAPSTRLSNPPGHGTRRGKTLSVTVGHTSRVIDVVLRVIYDMPCQQTMPELDIISLALSVLDQYGLSTPNETSPSEIWSLVLRHARTTDSIQAYALAAAHSMDKVCIEASAHTLRAPLENITEQQANLAGPIYLRRLFLLHMSRRESLRAVMERPPIITGQHDLRCSAVDREGVARSWALAAANVMTLKTAPQGVGGEELSKALLSEATEGRTCEQCLACIRDRISEVVHDWLAIKATI